MLLCVYTKTLHRVCDVKLEEQVGFRYKLGLEMIHNEYIENETKKSSRNVKDKTIGAHELIGLPPYVTFKNGKLVACKTQYIQLKCSSCPKMCYNDNVSEAYWTIYPY